MGHGGMEFAELLGNRIRVADELAQAEADASAALKELDRTDGSIAGMTRAALAGSEWSPPSPAQRRAHEDQVAGETHLREHWDGKYREARSRADRLRAELGAIHSRARALNVRDGIPVGNPDVRERSAGSFPAVREGHLPGDGCDCFASPEARRAVALEIGLYAVRAGGLALLHSRAGDSQAYLIARGAAELLSRELAAENLARPERSAGGFRTRTSPAGFEIR